MEDFINNPFPSLTQFVRDHYEESERLAYFQYLYSVRYHLVRSWKESRECESSLWNVKFTLYSNGTVTLTDYQPKYLIWHGDTAIREAISALDTGLMLTNFLLNINLPQEKVNWPRLNSCLEDDSSKLREVIRSVFDPKNKSKGYSLLSGYRNWVTHRGAPSLSVPDEIYGPIDLPAHVLFKLYESLDKERNANPSSDLVNVIIDSHVKIFILQFIAERMEVVCWPVYPPVSLRYDFDSLERSEDIVLPGGIHIDKIAGAVKIEDARVVSSSLFDGSSDYDKQNNVSLAKREEDFAGEKLAVYSINDYVSSVNAVVNFVRTMPMGEWDAELRKICASRWKPNVSN